MAEVRKGRVSAEVLIWTVYMAICIGTCITCGWYIYAKEIRDSQIESLRNRAEVLEPMMHACEMLGEFEKIARHPNVKSHRQLAREANIYIAEYNIRARAYNNARKEVEDAHLRKSFPVMEELICEPEN